MALWACTILWRAGKLLDENAISGRDGTDVFIDRDLRESPLSGFDVSIDVTAAESISSEAAAAQVSTRLTRSLGGIAALTEANIAALLTPQRFLSARPAACTVQGIAGTFVALNNGQAGFSAAGDAILHLSNSSITTATPILISGTA